MANKLINEMHANSENIKSDLQKLIKSLKSMEKLSNFEAAEQYLEIILVYLKETSPFKNEVNHIETLANRNESVAELTANKIKNIMRLIKNPFNYLTPE